MKIKQEVKQEECLVDALSHGMGSPDTEATITSTFHGVYQELGLDSVVAGLELEDQNQDLGRLAKATQEKAASDLLFMRREKRGKEEMPSPPAKRSRLVAETPVRDRVDVARGSPSSSVSDSQPEDASKSVHSTPSNSHLTPPITPANKRRGEDTRTSATVAVTYTSSGRRTTVRQAAKAAMAPRNTDSDTDGAGYSPRAAATPSSSDRHGRGSSGFVLSDKERKNQGLRQFSLRVCRQVKAKQKTTYNEVADELVKEFQDDDSVVCDEKNIRRRAYDALNVLTAMDIITKNRKDIEWQGFPALIGVNGPRPRGATCDREKQRLQGLVDEKKAEVRAKRQQLEDLATHYVSLRQLLHRNERPEFQHALHKLRINLPFVMVNTDQDNRIDYIITKDKKTARVDCTHAFELHDDRETLRRMDLHHGSPPLSELVSSDILPFVRKRELGAEIESGWEFGQTARGFVRSEDECDANDAEQEEMGDD